MYGKVFETIYESTVADDWRSLITMIQLIVLADHRGEVHHSIRGLHRITGIPLEHLKAGIEMLESPDPESQSKTEEGRRIIRFPEVDGRQPVGWKLVNYEYYRDLGSRYENKEKAAARQRRKRIRDGDKSQKNTNKRDTSQAVTDSHACHGDTDTDTDFNNIWVHYPKRAGSNPKKRARKAFSARITEGSTFDGISQGVDRYYAYCEATGKLNTEYVMQAVTFFGPEHHYANKWELPNETRGKLSAPERVEAAIRRRDGEKPIEGEFGPDN